MTNQFEKENSKNHYGFLSGGGELGSLIRNYDWLSSALGAVSDWPQSLRSALSICLNSNFPIAIYWGDDLHLLYNDAWKSIPGNKHPAALGMTARQVWPEIWPDIEPQFQKAFSGEPGGSKDALLPMQRHGYTEECYFDFTFTPIYGDQARVEGVFNAVIETTYRVISERRMAFLKRLPLQLAQCQTSQQVYRMAIEFVKESAKDVPFAYLYTIEDKTDSHFITSTQALQQQDLVFKQPLPISRLSDEGKCILIENLSDYLLQIPLGFWPETPSQALLVPMKDSKAAVNGYIFFGLSARLRYDEEYLVFLEGVVNAITTVVKNIEALHTERKRFEELKQLDDAKTAFFTNISHEFRTPLTLLLGPVEQLLTDTSLDPSQKARIEPVYRNTLRMQKLVNTLLEFSRIEAGRVQIHFVKADIGALTADLASTFRSAVELAGMQLQINISPIHADVYVDIQMWEKIILNLISNAFKYTTSGGITIDIGQRGDQAVVTITDTGCGIAAHNLGLLFERFRRIESAAGRSQEGTGIGLALVKELVSLLKGNISVNSELGVGSSFTVSIPVGSDHLSGHDLSAQPQAGGNNPKNPYQAEAMGWAFQQESQRLAMSEGSAFDSSNLHDYKVLIADDNADMRQYIERLLSDQFSLVLSADGQHAFEQAMLHRPDLIISDVMMPRLDGFGLLRKIRSSPELKNTPVIFLSARAGEEAKLEGLNAGADDYLVKPFSAKELIVRVANHIRINQVRRQTEQQFYQLFLQAPSIINVFKGPEHIYEIFHPHNKKIFGDVDFSGMRLIDALPELDSQGIVGMLDQVYHEKKTITQNQMPVVFTGKDGKKSEHFFNLTYQPWLDHRGLVQGVLNFAVDVTEVMRAKTAIEKSEQNLRNIIMQAPVPMCILRGESFIVETANMKMLELWGKKQQDVFGSSIMQGLPELKEQGFEKLLSDVYHTGERYAAFEMPILLLRSGEMQQAYVNFVYEALKDADGSISGVMAVAMEVTEQVIARRRIEDAEEKARLAIESADLGTYEVDIQTNQVTTSLRFDQIWGVRQPVTRELLESRVHPQDRSIREQAHQQAGRSGILEYQIRVIWPDQSIHWVKVSGKLIFDESAKPTMLLGVIQDITDQVQFSEQLHLLVQERTQQLQRSNQDLQQFAHVASHDLKEPVRKIKLFSGRLQSDYWDSLDEKGRAFIQKIQQSTDRMFTMIDGVLKYSSLNQEQDQSEPVDLNRVMDGIESDLEILIDNKHALILREKLPFVTGSNVLIYQLFYNLINNSLKFSRPQHAPRIAITASVVHSDTPFVRIQVSDNGIGFDQKYADHIFETFTRLNAKDDYEGTGLGLALCKKIVERHQGVITAQSEINQGTVFTILLPL